MAISRSPWKRIPIGWNSIEHALTMYWMSGQQGIHGAKYSMPSEREENWADPARPAHRPHLVDS
jgi:hypothetical protein